MAEKMWQRQGHAAPLVAGVVINLDNQVDTQLQEVLVTACTQGVVKIWKVHEAAPPEVLAFVACPSGVSVVAALPIPNSGDSTIKQPRQLMYFCGSSNGSITTYLSQLPATKASPTCMLSQALLHARAVTGMIVVEAFNWIVSVGLDGAMFVQEVLLNGELRCLRKIDIGVPIHKCFARRFGGQSSAPLRLELMVCDDEAVHCVVLLATVGQPALAFWKRDSLPGYEAPSTPPTATASTEGPSATETEGSQAKIESDVGQNPPMVLLQPLTAPVPPTPPLSAPYDLHDR